MKDDDEVQTATISAMSVANPNRTKLSHSPELTQLGRGATTPRPAPTSRVR